MGSCYPPDFYSWIKDSKTRKKFEQLSIETEEDFQLLIKKLKEFNVDVLRPEIPKDISKFQIGGRWVQPPVTPRDYFLMIQDKFFIPQHGNAKHARLAFNRQTELDWAEFTHRDQLHHDTKLSCYTNVFDHIRAQGNDVVYTDCDLLSGCWVSRIGHDLYFSTHSYDEDLIDTKARVDKIFPDTRNHIVNTGGHGDSVYCPITPGLIVSVYDVPTYADTFPDWEVVYLPPSNFSHTQEFQDAMKFNRGRWFMPGFEQNPKLIEMVDYYFDTWVGQVSETVFYVNILIVDPKNIIVTSYNKQVDDACRRYGVTMHVVPFRHRFFWDAGTHCITNDLHREGQPGIFVNI